MKNALALFLLALAADSSSAATLEFSGLNTNTVAFHQVASWDASSFSGNYHFTSIGGHLGAWTTASNGTFVAGLDNNPQGGTQNVSISDYDNSGLITMSEVNGLTFSVSSLDITQWGGYAAGSILPNTVTVTFNGYDSGDHLIGSSSCQFSPTTGAAPLLSPCNLGLNDIAYLQVEQGGYNAGTAFQFTHVDAYLSSAPEPATWSLLLGCLGAAAFRQRCRRS